MSPNSFHTLGASLQVLPAAFVFSRRLLLPENRSDTGATGLLDVAAENHPPRSVPTTPRIRDFGGYSHGGIND